MAEPQAKPAIAAQATSFIHRYAAHFASPRACDAEHIAALTAEIGKLYRPGVTFFTNGRIQTFATHDAAASLIEHEMRNNVSTGLGTKLVLEAIERCEVYSESSVMCWLRWRFEPQDGSPGWGFVNVYGYRRGEDGEEGWEFVVRDCEVNEMVKVRGASFE